MYSAGGVRLEQRNVHEALAEAAKPPLQALHSGNLIRYHLLGSGRQA